MSAVDLGGKVALVTGGARRLGRHLCEELGARGAHVFVHYNRSATEAQAVVEAITQKGGEASVLAGDLLDPRSPKRMMETIRDAQGRLDVLINNVGNYPLGPIEDATPQEWRDTLEANLIAPFGLIQEALAIIPSEGASIVNIGYAGVELVRANTQATAYQVSKTGLLILTKTIAERFGPRGIRCNMVSPGQLENSVDLPEGDALLDAIPLGRAGRMSDIARAVFFLLQKDSYVSGTNIDVAGGYLPPRN